MLKRAKRERRIRMAYIKCRSQTHHCDSMVKNALMRLLHKLVLSLGLSLLSFAVKFEQMLCGQDDRSRGQAFSRHL